MTTNTNAIANIASTLVGNKPVNPKSPSKGITMLSPELTLIFRHNRFHGVGNIVSPIF